ncbi:MAG: peptidylprolyl isomerase [Mariprofundaceae bacterium]|nr:peptidylprolyl isomerase [Mariprofundaceae bacterium]
MKNKAMISLTLAALFFMMPACSDAGAVDSVQISKETVEKTMSKAPKQAPSATDKDLPEGNHVLIETDSGSIKIELLPDVAPNTVANFKVLASNGYYDGIIFHRVIPGFMAQAGDPTGTGTSGPGYRINAEFNATKHVRGTVAMARTSDPDSAGSQFYICFAPQPHLDRQYTVFGQVVEGMEVVDQVKNGTVMNRVTLQP